MGRRSVLLFSVAFLLLGRPMARAQAPQPVEPDMRIENGKVFVRGKWSPTDTKTKEELAHLPLVELHCFKSEMYCMQAIASANDGEPGLAVQYYKVNHWDKNTIIAENQDFSCTTNQIRIILKENIVLAVDAPKKNVKPVVDACKDLAHAIKYKLIGESPEPPAAAPGNQMTHP